MEITQRETLGENLLAPKTDAAGREQWSYSLVAHVRPGDRVLHYRTNEPGGPAIVGWSEVVGEPSTGIITWQARGTRGRERGEPTTGPSWFVPLGGKQAFAKPITGVDIARHSDKIFQVREQITAAHGTPAYFPFIQYRPGEVRAQQGYLAKFPVELLAILPRMRDVIQQPARDPFEELEEEHAAQGSISANGRISRIQDPILRSAIEQHAVSLALDHYRRQGCTQWTVLGKPYDLKVIVADTERHVEVKGSSMTVNCVELTINEVIHAEDFSPTDLIVVDGIKWIRDGQGRVATSGGRLRIWEDWIPSDSDLVARRFAYSLPRD